MFKTILIIFVSGVLILGASNLSFAMMCHGQSSHQQMSQAGKSEHQEMGQEAATQAETKEVINVGNKICPVSGEKIDEKMKATYEYEGKVYNFCCEMCIEDFKKDPQKYIKKIEEELEAESKKETEAGASSQSQGMHEGHHH